MTELPGDITHLILDRDGVLNDESSGPVGSPTSWRWVPGSRAAVRWWLEQGVAVSVVTNQSAVGSGVLSMDAVRRLHAAVAADVGGARVAELEFLVCPHRPDAGCPCRKPEPGLVQEALSRRGVPPRQSLLVGDAPTDLEAGRRAGLAVALVRTGKGASTASSPAATGVPTFPSLLGLASASGMPVCDDPGPGERIAPEVLGWFDHLHLVESGAHTLLPRLDAVVAEAVTAISSGGRIIAFGNGGSAADAAHFVSELVGRFTHDRAPIPALALGQLPSLSSALANDLSFEAALEREVRALARSGDLVVALSTSGRSPNVLAAVRAARGAGCRVVVMTGGLGRGLAEEADVSVCVPSSDVPRIQELHGLLLHTLAGRLERELNR